MCWGQAEGGPKTARNSKECCQEWGRRVLGTSEAQIKNDEGERGRVENGHHVP